MGLKDTVLKSIWNSIYEVRASITVSELVQDKLQIFVGRENSPFHLSGNKKLDLFDNWLVQLVQPFWYNQIGTTSYQTGPIFCPPKDGKVNFHVQQKFEVYLEPAPIF